MKQEDKPNPVGRPLKYKTVEEFKTSSSGWSTEKEFVDYIELNIHRFTEEVLNEEYAFHKREWYPKEGRAFGANKPRIDLMVKTRFGRRYGVECKLPRRPFAELSRTVSQLLSYGVLADQNYRPFDGMYILTTQYHPIVNQIIEKYELPIKVVVFSKNMRAESQW